MMDIMINSTDEMTAFGERVARSLRTGAVVELIGDVGAGKTTFTKGFARGLGIDGDVSSPSFTISRVYDTPDGRTLHHYDFYRLTDAGILKDELGEVVNDPSAIVVIEWADIVEGVLPEDHIRITIRATGEETRHVLVRGWSAA